MYDYQSSRARPKEEGSESPPPLSIQKKQKDDKGDEKLLVVKKADKALVVSEPKEVTVDVKLPVTDSKEHQKSPEKVTEAAKEAEIQKSESLKDVEQKVDAQDVSNQNGDKAKFKKEQKPIEKTMTEEKANLDSKDIDSPTQPN